MTTRTSAPVGAPCWVDLWTSDVDGSRAFYSQLFGWEALEPDEQFGGYFMFQRNGTPVAGGMGDIGEMKADDRWKVYLCSDDIGRTVKESKSRGATAQGDPMPVADLGSQIVMQDPTGASVGVWQPGTFPGFTVLDEQGTPSWFELHTNDHATAVSFYEEVYGLTMQSMGDTDEFRYTVFSDTNGTQLGGIMDAKSFLGAGSSNWAIYWHVDDCGASAAKVTALGGSVLDAAQATPYGTIASVADPAGATFRLRTPPA
jgi:predicted enzyme related to lactoylglutathione lyase